MKKFESTIQPGLFFWAEQVELPDGKKAGFAVIAQAKDYPASEAFDDWLANEKDAEEIAERLSKGEEV